jgi:hypothetical protein
MTGVLQSIVIGVRRRWMQGFRTALSVLGTIWLLTEVATRVSNGADEWLDANGAVYLALSTIAAVAGFAFSSYERRKVEFTIPNSDTTLTLKFSSIFDEDADWIIGVNDFFDSTLGHVVATTSLHGQIIDRCYNGNAASFRADVDASLANCQGEIVQRSQGETTRYPLGTTAVIPRGPRKIFLVAISKTDATTHRVSSTMPILWDALSEAIRVVDEKGNGFRLAMPLIGNGRASLNIPPQHLLRIITLRLTELSKQYDLPRSITINLADDCFEHLDLLEIKRGWSKV